MENNKLDPHEVVVELDGYTYKFGVQMEPLPEKYLKESEDQPLNELLAENIVDQYLPSLTATEHEVEDVQFFFHDEIHYAIEFLGKEKSTKQEKHNLKETKPKTKPKKKIPLFNTNTDSESENA